MTGEGRTTADGMHTDAKHWAEVTRLRARVAELEAEVESLEPPCDGGCSYYTGPEETCSAHGRPVAEVWEIVNRFGEERENLARLHEVATERTVALAAVIERALAELESDHDFARSVAATILHNADTGTVLAARDAEKDARIAELALVIDGLRGLADAITADSHCSHLGRDIRFWTDEADTGEALREVRAKAWDDGLDAGRDRWMDNREFGDPPVNPYLEGAKTDG